MREHLAQVTELLPRVNFQADVAAAVAEVAVVVDQAGEPRRLKGTGIGVEPHVHETAEAVAHHHRRVRPCAVREIEPPGQLHAVGHGHADLARFHRSLP